MTKQGNILFSVKTKQKELHFHIYMDRVAEELTMIKNAINELPVPMNIVFVEYFINETPSQKIITMLNLTRGKFYKLLDQGKILLRKRLNNGIYDKAKKLLYGRIK